jgi:dTDP-4-dehydrorhamnose reductase
MRVAVTGAGGRLGQALVTGLGAAPFVDELLAWDWPVHDLDDPSSAERLVSAARPNVVVHTAAWTDVDGCAGDPELAMRRNGTATGELARACVERGAGLVTISTNEVFDGRRTDGLAYRSSDRPNPTNPYGTSKLAGELAAREAFGAADEAFAEAAVGPDWAGRGMGQDAPDAGPALAIVRTSWLFGPPGADFPHKILAAARRAAAEGRPLDLVADEVGCPTYARYLAGAIVSLLKAAGIEGPQAIRGIHHVVNSGSASRADWAREVLRLGGIEVATREVTLEDWPRPSTPPRWGVLWPTPLPQGPLPEWRGALAEYLSTDFSTQEPAR